MDQQWRHPPPQGSLCPVCSVAHFPFCPPYHPPLPPYNQNPGFPPPPNFPRPDPYNSGMPALYLSNPSDGWHRGTNFDYRGGFGPPMYDYRNSGYVEDEVDRSFKRARVDAMGPASFGHEANQNHARILSDDERRLKLIRDHGGASAGNVASGPFDREKGGNLSVGCQYLRNDGGNLYSPFQPNSESQNAPYLQQGQVTHDPVLARGPHYSRGNNWQDHRPPPQQPFNRIPDYQPAGESFDERQQTEFHQGFTGNQNWPGVSQYDASNPNGSRMFGSQPPPPPLPAVPPPPLPMEPPGHHAVEFKAYTSPPKSSFSLFPVPINSSSSNPYLNNKPDASSGSNLQVSLFCYLVGLGLFKHCFCICILRAGLICLPFNLNF